MERALRDAVWARAGLCCEYCLMPQALTDAVHEIDHVIAEKHLGAATLENLALACFLCNNAKGPCIAGIDPISGEITRLFHPRLDEWDSHFEWQGALLSGKTPVARATIQVLGINDRRRVRFRQALIEEGIFPPFWRRPGE